MLVLAFLMTRVDDDANDQFVRSVARRTGGDGVPFNRPVANSIRQSGPLFASCFRRDSGLESLETGESLEKEYGEEEETWDLKRWPRERCMHVQRLQGLGSPSHES